jgi:hypothetical protein
VCVCVCVCVCEGHAEVGNERALLRQGKGRSVRMKWIAHVGEGGRQGEAQHDQEDEGHNAVGASTHSAG